MRIAVGALSGFVRNGLVLALVSLVAASGASAQDHPGLADGHSFMLPAPSNPHQVGQANPHQPGQGDTNPHEMGTFASSDRKDATWTVPSGWTVLPSTSMRLGNFLYTAPNGQKVEITISSLPGTAGGAAANFSMWRSQLGLPHLDDAEVLKQGEKIRVGQAEMDLINIVSAENIIEGKSKARIVGVVYPRAGNTWFFKMKGEDAAVAGAKGAFLAFLDTVKFQDGEKI